MIQIVIVDDDILVTTALKTILESNDDIEVAAIGQDGKDAIALYLKYHPDILLTDIQMKEVDGLQATEEILKLDKDAKILLLTTFNDDEYIIKALQIGAKGYLLKQDYNSIYPALKAVKSGQSVFGTEVISKLPDFLQQKSSFDYSAYAISKKELQIIELIADGLSNKEIAAQLFLSEGTVRNYLSHILEKLELRDRTQLAVFYYQHI